MASRNFPSNRLYNMHVFPVQLDMLVSIGSTGACTLVTSNNSGMCSAGIKSITRLAAGVYQAQLSDNYATIIGLRGILTSTVTGSAIAATALNPTTVYQIITMGTTTQANWVTAGVPSGITAQVGTVFLCAATSSGTGTAKAIAAQNIQSVELVGNPDLMSNNQPFQQGNGGAYVTFQTIAPTSSSVTTPVATDPTSGTQMRIVMLLSNSSIS